MVTGIIILLCLVLLIKRHNMNASKVVKVTFRRVAKDGDPGPGGVSMIISPNGITAKRSDKAQRFDVYVDFYRGSDHIDYANPDDGNLITSGLSGLTSELTAVSSLSEDKTRRKFTLFLSANAVINTTITFTATLDGKIFDCSFPFRTIVDGTDGKPGTDGKDGKTYQPTRIRYWLDMADNDRMYPGTGANDPYTDIVFVKTDEGNKYYRCIKECSKAHGSIPSENRYSGYLVGSERIEVIATGLILADLAVIKNLIAEGIIMQDDKGNVVFRASGGTVECNKGVFKDVTVTGTLTATEMWMKVSTADDAKYINGSFVLNRSSIFLPKIEEGRVITIKILNPGGTKMAAEDLILTAVQGNACYASPPSYLWMKGPSLRVKGAGVYGARYLELVGYWDKDLGCGVWAVTPLDGKAVEVEES